MADTTFATILPPIKAVDLGDGTSSIAVQEPVVPAGGTDLTLANVIPPIKVVDLGDGTYAIAVSPV